MRNPKKLFKEVAASILIFSAVCSFMVIEEQPFDILTVVLVGFLSTIAGAFAANWKEITTPIKQEEDEQKDLEMEFRSGMAGSYFMSAHGLAFNWKKRSKYPTEYLQERANKIWPILMDCARINQESPLQGSERSVVMVENIRKIFPHGRYQLQYYYYEFHREKAASDNKDMLPVRSRIIWHVMECINIVYDIDTPVLVNEKTANSHEFAMNKFIVQEMLALYFDATQLISAEKYKEIMQAYLPVKGGVLYSEAEKESHRRVGTPLAFDACTRLLAYWSEYSPALPYFEAWIDNHRIGWPADPVCASFTDDEIKMTMTMYFVVTGQVIRKDWMSVNPYIYGVLMADNAYQKGNILSAIDTIVAGLNTEIES